MQIPDWLKQIIEQFQAMPQGRQLTFVGAALGMLLFFAWLGIDAASPEYRVLYRGLADEEASQVVDVLDEEKIPYRFDDGALAVPASLVHDARIRVAGKGLPAGGGAGFEIFDNQGFGVTDFVMRVNFRRALQGELARSIEHIESVNRARVQIAIPSRSTFVTDLKRKASASVVLQLRPGQDLGAEEVRGIVHLVSSSVEGLQSDQVTVVDNRGRMLAPQAEVGLGHGAPSGALAHQAKVEKELAQRIQQLLGRTVGSDRVIARVSAELDWDQLETTEEKYDPDSQVARSEQIQKEESTDAMDDPVGVPGVVSNNPEIADVAAGNRSVQSSTRSNETINYEINRTVNRKVAALGTIQRLNVAVLIDGKPVAAGAGGDEAAPEFVPWEAEELERFENLVKDAVGFNAQRGDQITLTSAPFRDLHPDDGMLAPEWLPLAGTAIKYLGLLLALFLFARMVAKPLIASIAEPLPTPLGMSAGDLEAELAGEGGAFAALNELPAAPPSLADQVGDVVRERGEAGARTIQTWLKE